MGADLILGGFTTKAIPTDEYAKIEENARGVLTALTDYPQAWLGSDLATALMEWSGGEEIDPGDSDDTGLRDAALPALEMGLVAYMVLMGGSVRWATSWDILAGKAVFHTFGGTTWGDDPFDEWGELMFLASVASVEPALAEAIGFLGWGVVVP